MIKKYKYYLFDFDGTVLDTMPSLAYVFTVSYEHVGCKFDPKDTALFSRIPLDEGYQKIGANPDKWSDFCDYIRASLDFPETLKRNHFYPESQEIFQYIKDHNIYAGIVTSNNVSHVKDVLKVMGIDDKLFRIYIGHEEYEHFKPDPDPLLQALKKMGNPNKEDVVYVGDALNDALCAERAGIDAILLDRNNEYQNSPKYLRITNLKELFKE